MKKANLEDIQQYLVDCKGCGKKHLPIGVLFRGGSYCASCKKEMETCAISGENYMKKEMKHFKLQDIYIKSPNIDLIVKSSISKKEIYIGTVIKSKLTPDLFAGKLANGKYALVGELVGIGYILTSANVWADGSTLFRYGTETVPRENTSDHLESAGKLVLGYSTKPEPIFRKMYENEHMGIGVPYLGLELEVNTMSRDSAEKVLSKKVIDLMVKTDLIENFYMKHDGSIGNGVEIVSHPTTLSYFKKSKLKEMIEGIKEIGFQDDDTCGLHIHVSRDSLSKKGWWTLMSFISKVNNKFVKLSRRQKDKMSYCSFDGLRGGVMDALLSGKEIFTHDITKNGERRLAVNFNNKNTVEFRLFRSTVDHDTLIATMELVEALVLFCREYSFMYVQDERSSELWNEFTKFASNKGYKKLINLMKSMGLVYINEKTKKVCA